jgi:hypothetical protein
MATVSHRRRVLRSIVVVPLVLLMLCAGVTSVARVAVAIEDEPGERLGLGSYNGDASSSGNFLGFINRDRLKHSRSLSFGLSTGSGAANNLAGGTFSDYFTYRLRDNLTMNLALHYSYISTFRSADEERGQFSVLPAFDLEYHPSPNSSLRVSYGQYNGGYPFLAGRPHYSSGRPYFPY